MYVLHVSDGDNFSADNQRTLELISRLTEVCSLVGYLEVDPRRARRGRTSCRRSTRRRPATSTGFVFAEAADDRELWPALKRFFAKDDVEAAVR